MNEEDKFEICSDLEKKLLRITMRGHWTIDTVDQYKIAVTHVVSDMYRAGCSKGDILALVDVRSGGAQSQDVIAYYQGQMGSGGLTPKRLATLVTSMLFKMQVERIAIPNQRVFVDEDEALGWLMMPDSSEATKFE